MKSVLQNNFRSAFRRMSTAMLLIAMVLSTATILSGCGTESDDVQNAYNFPVIEATSDFYVNDFAGLFTESQKDEMMQKAIKLDEEYGGIQVVVTTVKTLDECVIDGSKKSIEQIAVAMYNQYGIGQDDMGILILFASEDREVIPETGHRMQAYITDGLAGEILNEYGIGYFENDQFAEGLMVLQEAMISEIRTVVPSDWNAGNTETINRNEPKQDENAAMVPVTPVQPNSSENSDSMTQVENQEKTDASNGGALPVLQIIVGILIIVLTGLYLNSLIHFRKERRNYEQKLKDSRDVQETLKMMLDEAHVQEEAAVAKTTQSYESKMKQFHLNEERRVATFQNQIIGLNRELDEKSRKLTQKEQDLCQQTLALEEMKEKYSRIKALHPEIDFEAEVKQMIEDEYKARAEVLDKELSKYVGITPDKDQVSTLYHALHLYSNESHEVYRYLKTDMKRIQSLYDESKRLKAQFEKEQQDNRDRASAQKACENMKPAYDDARRNGATYRNYDSLKAAVRIYNGLGENEKRFFPEKAMISELNSMLSDAEADSSNKSAARNLESEVERVINYMSRGREDDVDKLERLLRRYNALNMRQQKHFNSSLLDKLQRLLREAKEDHDEQERRRARERREREEKRERREREEREATARRARMSSSSSSSFGSSHHSYSGHGGRASGGGPSRRF